MSGMLRRRFVLGVAVGAAAAVGAVLVRRGRAERLSLLCRAEGITEQAVQGLGVPAGSLFVRADGPRLHTVVAGPPDGPLAVLLHGFPECWYTWRKQIVALARAGYRVVAPDQRGYNLSDKPAGVAGCAVDRLTADVVALIVALGRERAVVVGHDWGGVVAWRLAMDYPEVVEKLVVMNAPHPETFARELRTSWSQRLKSWYALLFQLPWLPETLLSLFPRSTARLFFRGTAVRKGAFTDPDLEVMAAALAQPGALRSMIHWYRAALRYGSARPARAIRTPTLVIWGEDDVALGLPLLYGLGKWAGDLRVRTLPHCGHWVQNEAPEEVNEALLVFLG